jgi:hypothetical protein
MTRVSPFRKAVVSYLANGQTAHLRKMDEAEWTRNFRWLDRSGLALPLATRVDAQAAAGFIPRTVSHELQRRLADNGKRMEEMLRIFGEITSALNASGVRYVCVKGFSLIPDCFGHIRERHQVDLDFLIDPQDAERATSAVEAVGHPLLDAQDSGELRFAKPRQKHLGVHAWLYQLPEAPAIELHTRVWEPEAKAIDFPALGSFLDSSEIHQTAGVRFPRLTAPYQFVYLLLHVFRHLIGSWVRPLSVYEIATLLHTRSTDHTTWVEAGREISADRDLASACALVLGIVARAFPMELPGPLSDVYAKNLSAESAFWLDKYSDAWLYTDPPGNKLALLVQRQFCSDPDRWRQYVQQRLLPLHSMHSLSDNPGAALKKKLSVRAEDLGYKISRAWYHVRSDYEYLAARRAWPRFTNYTADEA